MGAGSRIASIAAVVLAVCRTGSAGYELSVRSGGQGGLVVEPGEVLDIDVLLASPADEHLSCLLSVVFSDQGFGYEACQWSAPYVTGGPYDMSSPAAGELPLTITTDTYDDLLAAGRVDMWLSGVTGGALFGEGVLASLSLTAPAAASAWTWAR